MLIYMLGGAYFMAQATLQTLAVDSNHGNNDIKRPRFLEDSRMVADGLGSLFALLLAGGLPLCGVQPHYYLIASRTPPGLGSSTRTTGCGCAV